MNHTSKISPTSAPIARRHFLLGSVAAGVTLAGTAGASSALAVDAHDVFAAPATEYGVPAALLAAVSHAQTRWQDHAGRPSTSAGYGPMHLVDGAAAQQARDDAMGTPGARVIDTLADAARASGVSAQALRTDPAANVRGAAALLATLQRTAGRPTGTATDPATWIDAVARACGLGTAAAQLAFVDDVVATLRAGATRTVDGHRLTLAPTAVGDTGPQRSMLQARVRAASGHRPRGPVDAPRGLDVEWYPAPYEQYGPAPADYGNHDLAQRPTTPALTHIVIHDTEATFQSAKDLVSDPTYLAWNYTVRSADGHIAQHLQPWDIGWHAGNWWINMHSFGVEHEGYAALGPTWYSEPLYRHSARLVAYLARKYDIQVDRGHIIGHDQVPGENTAKIPSQHWDPGPFWDWEHYFDLLGAPLRRGTLGRRARPGDVVRILPGYDGNVQPVTGCSDPTHCVDGTGHGTNFVPLHTAPSDDSPLVGDAGEHQAGQPATTAVDDIGSRATAGLEYVVAQVQGDWTAIWWLGAKAWFHDPRHAPTARVVPGRRTVTPKGGGAQVFGAAYPELSAYPDPALAHAVEPLLYTVPAGQAYVVLDEHVPTDFYRAKTFSLDTPGDHTEYRGHTRYLLISYGHRVGFVRADQVRTAR